VTRILADADFGLTGVDDELSQRVVDVLREVRRHIGDA
jgi:hypothetical protein